MEIVVETYTPHGEPSPAKRRVRPLPGQGFDTSLKVRCSRSMRDQFPVGARFLLVVKPNSRQGGNVFLEWDKTTAWQHVTREEADRFIAERFGTCS